MRPMILAFVLSLASCSGCEPEPPTAEVIAPPSDPKVQCGGLLRIPGVAARFSDPRLLQEVGDERCRPVNTLDGWRCLPEWPVWDARNTLADAGDGNSLMDYPDIKPLPVYVFQFQRVGEAWRTARGFYLPQGQQTCNPLGCVLTVPQPLSLLRVSLTSFVPCEVPTPTPSEVNDG